MKHVFSRVPVELGEWPRDIPGGGVDHDLLGIQIDAVVLALRLRMGLAYQRIRDAINRDPLADRSQGFCAAVERDWASILPGRLDPSLQHAWSQARSAEMFVREQYNIRGIKEPSSVTLAEILTPRSDILIGKSRDRFRAVLRERFRSFLNLETIDEIANAAYDYLRVERAVLRGVGVIQRRIQALSGRPQPHRLANGIDLVTHHRLRARTPGALPYLMSLFEEVGVRVDNTEAATRLTIGSAVEELA